MSNSRVAAEHSDHLEQQRAQTVTWREPSIQADGQWFRKCFTVMWPFNPPTKKVEDVELPSNNEVSQSNLDSSTPSMKSRLDAVTSQEEPSTYHRLGMHPVRRVELMSGVAFFTGFVTGMSKGADIAGLCYRAENAHLTPTSKAGWFLYNKSKNYHTILGGAKQGLKTGGMYLGWTALFLTLEHGIDAARGRLLASRKEKEMGSLAAGQADFVNTVSAAVAVAGIHSWWYRMDRFAAARMTRGAVMFSVPFGLGQDLYSWLSGSKTWYIEGISRLVGRGSVELDEYEAPVQKRQQSV